MRGANLPFLSLTHTHIHTHTDKAHLNCYSDQRLTHARFVLFPAMLFSRCAAVGLGPKSPRASCGLRHLAGSRPRSPSTAGTTWGCASLHRRRRRSRSQSLLRPRSQRTHSSSFWPCSTRRQHARQRQQPQAPRNQPGESAPASLRRTRRPGRGRRHQSGSSGCRLRDGSRRRSLYPLWPRGMTPASASRERASKAIHAFERRPRRMLVTSWSTGARAHARQRRGATWR